MNLGIEIDYIFSVGVKTWKDWRSLRKEILKTQIECHVCGYEKKLEVHHITPRHVSPELALKWDNLIVLCRDCHFHIGHWCDFHESNPDVVEIAELARCKRVAGHPARHVSFDVFGC